MALVHRKRFTDDVLKLRVWLVQEMLRHRGRDVAVGAGRHHGGEVKLAVLQRSKHVYMAARMHAGCAKTRIHHLLAQVHNPCVSMQVPCKAHFTHQRHVLVSAPFHTPQTNEIALKACDYSLNRKNLLLLPLAPL